jgi:hypothetical protein
MSWLSSVVVGVLTAVIGGIAAGTIAALAVEWYSITSREGASGFFVLGFVLLAVIVGFIVGMVGSRIVAAGPNPGFLKALGYAQLAMLGTIGLIGGIARLLADVGPRIDGKDLMVNVEFRWPRGQEPPAAKEQWWVELGSVSNHVQRNSEDGPVWREDARLEDGFWIVPGAVNLYTSRGDRTLTLRPDSLMPTGYVANIPAYPGRKYLAWSEWFPKKRDGGEAPDTEFRFRYRLVQSGAPLRTQRFGDFEVDMLAQSVGSVTYSGHPRSWSAYATYAIRYKGKPLTIEGRKLEGDSTGQYQEATAVALIPGPQPALVVMVNAEQGYGEIMLLAPAGDSVRTEYIAHGPGVDAGDPLTNDTTVFERVANRAPSSGQVDIVAYATPGLYLFKDAILDTRTNTIRRFTAEYQSNLIDRIKPLAISPDELSYVRLAYDRDVNSSGDNTTLEVTNTATGEQYPLPFSKYTFHWGDFDDLTPHHVNHYFTWVKGPDGHDRLTQRQNVKPLPYQGRTRVDTDYREYRLQLATEGLRPAIIEWMVTELKGEALPQEGLSDFAREVKIDGKVVHVSWSKEDGHVGIWMDRGTDVTMVSTIGDRLNAALATGRFDSHFVTQAPAQ